MALHCPNCRYDTDDEATDACPLCGKPLLTDEEVRNDWGGHAGNPGPWFGTRMRLQKLQLVIITVFTAVAVIYWLQVWLKNQP